MAVEDLVAAKLVYDSWSSGKWEEGAVHWPPLQLKGCLMMDVQIKEGA